MKKLLLISATMLLLSSCATTGMYYWGTVNNGVSNYEKLVYRQYERQTPESICKIVVLYEDMINNPGGTRNVVPPGICAEYGFLLLQESTLEYFEKYATNRQKKVFESDDFSSVFAEKGVLMLQKEIELYPESEKFIKPFLERLTSE